MSKAVASSARVRIVTLTTLTLVAFAANSLLCRAALRSGLADPASFTLLRVGSGVAMLLMLVMFRGRRERHLLRAGSPASALALAAYAACFSFAYVRINAGVGALILFGAVQVTMIGWSMVRERFPAPAEYSGLVVALAGLAWLTLPHATAPDALGAALMAVAGLAWGAYSVRGRRAASPVLATAANFSMALPLVLLPFLARLHQLRLAPTGLLLAVLSGAVTSGLGYVTWYAVLPALGATRAAILQLLVPVIAVAGSIVLLGEPLTGHLAGSGLLIISGVLLALTPRLAPRPVEGN